MTRYNLKEDQTHAPRSYRSEGERRIAAVLNQYGIPFLYENPLKLSEGKRTVLLRPDFYLPESSIYIEYFGRVGNADYDARIQRKESLYRANNIPYIGLYPWNLCQKWPEAFLSTLEGKVSDYRPSINLPRYMGNASRPRPLYGRGCGRYRGYRR